MQIDIPRSGTRGARLPRLPGAFMRFMNGTMFRLFRNRQFQNAHVLELSTIGAKTNEPRRTTLMYFDDRPNAWLVVGSAGGAATNPAWLHNMAKHPDQVWVEMGTRKFKVTAETLKAEERAAAWQRITAQSPNFKGYETSTDREIPVIRLTAAS
jgi:deazaflavin-dependent oxidoreductase (nitroreductase family)